MYSQGLYKREARRSKEEGSNVMTEAETESRTLMMEERAMSPSGF